jgi:O-succinylbenzoate synthase
VGGMLELRDAVPDPELLVRHAVPADRRRWWLERLRRVHALAGFAPQP